MTEQKTIIATPLDFVETIIDESISKVSIEGDFQSEPEETPTEVQEEVEAGEEEIKEDDAEGQVTKEQIDSKINEARDATMEMIRSVIDNLRSQHMIIIDAAENSEDLNITIEQLAEARATVRDIDILKDPPALANFLLNDPAHTLVDPKPNVYSLSYPINIKGIRAERFRSICRMKSVDQLKFKETVKEIEEISDIRTKANLRGLINAILYRFSTPEIVEKHKALVKLLFVVIRTSLRVKVAPSVSALILKV